MEVLNAIKRIVKNTFITNGRSSLYDFSIYIFFGLLINYAQFSVSHKYTSENGTINFIYSTCGFGIVCRRLHDVGKNSNYYLWVFTIIGIIPYLYQSMWKLSDPQPNSHGEVPPCAEKGRFLASINLFVILLYIAQIINVNFFSSPIDKAMEELSNWKYSETEIQGNKVFKSEKFISNKGEYKFDTVFTCFGGELGLIYSLFKIENVHGSNLPIQMKLKNADISANLLNNELLKFSEILISKDENIVVTSFNESITKEKLLKDPISFNGHLDENNYSFTVDLNEIKDSEVFKKCNVK